MQPFDTTASEIVYEGHLSTVRVDTVAMADGEHEREVVEHPSAVAIVALDGDRRVVLLRQYRHPLRRRILELPAGILDVEGEEAGAAARRELAEEAGLAVDEVRHLVTFANSAGWSTETTSIYLGTGVREALRPDGFEATAEEADLEVLRLPLQEALATVAAEEPADAKTLLGLLLAARAVAAAP
jgi:ADP-ribose pyrophosphatase